MPGQVGPEGDGSGGGSEPYTGLSGSGTASRLAKFTAAETLGNSRVTDTGATILLNSDVGTLVAGDTTGEGNGTKLRIDDPNGVISIEAVTFRGTNNGFTDLGSSAVGFQQLFLDATITGGGTTGAQEINKSAGSVNFAALATSLVVTCDKCSASSIVLAVVATDDDTAQIKNVVPASGSFTINLVVAATAETRVNFWVLNN